MGLPGQFLYTVLDVSVRWGRSQSQIIDWAIADELVIVAAITTATIGGEVTGGLHQIAGSDVRPLFRPYGEADREVWLKRARKIGGEQCLVVSEPAQGVRITASDVLITAEEVERFEELHGLGRVKSLTGPGLPPRYDWDGFYVAVCKRVYTQGLPARQRELVLEMQEWSSPTRRPARRQMRAPSAAASKRSGTS